MQTETFDLDRFIRTSSRVDLSEVEWDRARETPLTSAEMRVMKYMMDIEAYTVIFLRDVLATRAAFDPDVTAFLTCWNFEELWHGEAFSRLLGEAGVDVEPDFEVVEHDSSYPTRRIRNQWIRRKLGAAGYASHVGTMFGSAAAGSDFLALQMTWGAVNELTTNTAYKQMIAKTRNVPLRQILEAIRKQERRHFAFYRAQARMRLARSHRARRLTRWAMDNLWAPVGTGVRPQEESDFTVTYVFNDPEGVVAVKEMDEIIAALPGLEGTHYLTEALREAAERSGQPFGL